HTRSYGDWSSDVCSSDLVRGRDHSAARDFVARVENAGVAHHTAFILVIPARAVSNHGEEIIVARLFHPRRLKDILAQEVDEFFRGHALKNATHQGIAVGRIVELRTRLRDQRIAGNELE